MLSAQLELLEDSDEPVFKVVIKEGKYHQIKRMFLTLGVSVVALKRIAIGGVALDESLAPGEARPLTEDELKNIVYRSL